MKTLMAFEICSFCNERAVNIDKLEPMVLMSGDEEMQCDVCKGIYKLPDCEVIKEIARVRRREK